MLHLTSDQASESGDSWTPSWAALGVPARSFVLLLKSPTPGENGEGIALGDGDGDEGSRAESTALGLRLRGRLSSSGKGSVFVNQFFHCCSVASECHTCVESIDRVL
jgi:hypothetical protein